MRYLVSWFQKRTENNLTFSCIDFVANDICVISKFMNQQVS